MIDWKRYLQLLESDCARTYNCSIGMCTFPEEMEYFYLEDIAKELNKYTTYVTKNETFDERLSVRYDDMEWKKFKKDLRIEKNNCCEISGLNYRRAKEWTKNIFGLEYENVNFWLNVHHISGDDNYKCFDKSKLVITNRAIHMMLHMYKSLVKDLPSLRDDFKLWFELGSLVPDDKGNYGWFESERKSYKHAIVI